MAMNGNALGDRIRQEIDALPDDQKGNREAVFRAMGRAIVEYLTQNAEVVLKEVLVNALSQAAVTAGDGGATLKTNLSASISAEANAGKIR